MFKVEKINNSTFRVDTIQIYQTISKNLQDQIDHIKFTEILNLNKTINQVEQKISEIITLNETIEQVLQKMSKTEECKANILSLNKSISDMEDCKSKIATLNKSMTSSIEDCKLQIATLNKSIEQTVKTSDMEDCKLQIATLNKSMTSSIEDCKSKIATLNKSIEQTVKTSDIEDCKSKIATLNKSIEQTTVTLNKSIEEYKVEIKKIIDQKVNKKKVPENNKKVIQDCIEKNNIELKKVIENNKKSSILELEKIQNNIKYLRQDLASIIKEANKMYPYILENKENISKLNITSIKDDESLINISEEDLKDSIIVNQKDFNWLKIVNVESDITTLKKFIYKLCINDIKHRESINVINDNIVQLLLNNNEIQSKYNKLNIHVEGLLKDVLNLQ